jgi:hypothetical protein
MNSMAMLVVILMLDGKITKYEYPMNIIECMSAVENAKKADNATLFCVKIKNDNEE